MNLSDDTEEKYPVRQLLRDAFGRLKVFSTVIKTKYPEFDQDLSKLETSAKNIIDEETKNKNYLEDIEYIKIIEEINARKTDWDNVEPF